MECTQQQNLPDWGILFDFVSSGYYGGFIDNFPPSEKDQQLKWRMCHDCVVKLLEVFPMLASKTGVGYHPCKDAEPCCRWAWRVGKNGDAEFANESKVWVTYDD
jgi:hypothetical protein